MRLKKVIIKNFRGYQGEHEIDISDSITAFIGKNDAGKSTVLEALEIFFGDAKPELGDLNIHAPSTDREIIIGCIFDNLPDDIVVDTSATTSLQKEYLTNEEGDFEVIYKFTCTASTISKNQTIIRAQHPTCSGYNNLLNLKVSELKSIGQNLGVVATDQRVSSLWRYGIWEHAVDLGLKKIDLMVDDFDTKVKSIYTNLVSLYPQYFIFKVDRQTTDSDSEAKDPMQLAVKEAQKEYQQDIADLQAKIQAKVDKVAEDALSKLKEMDESLASKLNPVLKSVPKWTFDYRIEDDRGISLNKRGSGTRRLVLLNFFRAEAEKKSAINAGNIVYAIEEPETSQHPNNQRMIIQSLLDLAGDSKRQVLITTHSPQLTEKLPLDSVRFIEYDNINNNVSVHNGDTGLSKVSDSLGILSNQKLGSAKAVVVVEGETDEQFLNYASEVLSKDGHISISLSDAKITVLPAGSCSNVPFWTQKKRLQDLGLPYAIFIDSDRLSITDLPTRNEIYCQSLIALGEKAYTTKKREIENYIEPSLTGVAYGDYDDAKKLIGLHNTIRGKKVIGTYWPIMTSDQIIKRSTYIDNGINKVEIIDLLNNILELVL